MKNKLLLVCSLVALWFISFGCNSNDDEEVTPDLTKSYILVAESRVLNLGIEKDQELATLTIRDFPEDSDHPFEFKVDLKPGIDSKSYTFSVDGAGSSAAHSYAGFKNFPYINDIDIVDIEAEKIRVKMNFEVDIYTVGINAKALDQ
jgi:hypothetical protein